MSMLDILRPGAVSEVPENHFLVVHPLDDVQETKIDTSGLGTMPMTGRNPTSPQTKTTR